MNHRTLYEQVMGEEFTRLPAAVRRFHTLLGRHTLNGWVETAAPSTGFAKLLAWCLGTPQSETSGGIRFELEASPHSESWTRHFPQQTMTSRLYKMGPFVEEKLGKSTLHFRLLNTKAGLKMELQSLRFLGVPCPKWLLPSIVAEEHGDQEKIHFEVRASLPVVGVVASYRGHLIVGLEARP